MTNDLHRTNINLRKDDVDWLRDTFGFGWTEQVRDVVHEYVRQAKHGGSLDYPAPDKYTDRDYE